MILQICSVTDLDFLANAIHITLSGIRSSVLFLNGTEKMKWKAC